MSATAIVLGSAQDGGNPQLGSGGRGPRRLVTSVAVIGPAGSVLLLDVTPDVREQMQLLEPHRTVTASGNVVDHICLTHAHVGHYAGLVHFGKEAHNARDLPTWVTASMATFITNNQPWRALVDGRHLALNVVAPGEPATVAEGLHVRFVTVPHRDEFSDTVGISVNDELLYVPDIDAWEQWPAAEQEITRHRIALLDGCFASAAELPGRDLAEFPHPLVTDTIERFAHLTADRRLILTHLNHSNPVAEPGSPAAQAVAAAGFEVAIDGMELPLAAD